jgi:pimeloyl-ACP methyl ester carboxylesterase
MPRALFFFSMVPPSRHREWGLDPACLSSYHLLVPDLPSHGRLTSANIPFTILDIAALLADLVTKRAKGGKADIIGLSFGGYNAIYTAHKYPDLVGNGNDGPGLAAS